MRLTIFFGGASDLDGQVQAIVDAERDGFDGIYLGQVFGLDALTVLALAGKQTSRIELGTSVVPTYTRHPVAMAQQALTVQAAADGRFVLGIGLSHAPVVEGMWGIPYERPAAHMREYLSVLGPLTRDGRASFSGELFNVNQGLQIRDVQQLPIVLAALAPAMLRLAGEAADGTVTWMVGRKTLETHIVPRISRAAEAAGG